MNKQKASQIVQKLKGEYPDAKPALEFENNFQLLDEAPLVHKLKFSGVFMWGVAPHPTSF